MNMYGWALVIFLTFVIVPLGVAWWMGRGERIPLARLADPAPLPGELPRAGFLQISQYGPFPVDTGPLLILSDKTAANAALEREIRAMGDEAEGKIPPRWRS